MSTPAQFLILHMDRCPICSEDERCPTGTALFEAWRKAVEDMYEPPPLPPIPRLN